MIRLFEMGCHLIILGCNTASAKALRSIQENDLPKLDPKRRVLGIIRPTAEIIGSITHTRHVGIFATEGTIKSESYNLEIHKLFKRIDQLMRLDADIDTVILGCTHYPLLLPKIHKYMPRGIRIISQGEYVADSLKNYFQRHPEIEQRCTKGGQVHYLTTENPEKFKEQAQIFLHEPVEVENVVLGI